MGQPVQIGRDRVGDGSDNGHAVGFYGGQLEKRAWRQDWRAYVGDEISAVAIGNCVQEICACNGYEGGQRGRAADGVSDRRNAPGDRIGEPMLVMKYPR